MVRAGRIIHPVNIICREISIENCWLVTANISDQHHNSGRNDRWSRDAGPRVYENTPVFIKTSRQ